MVYDITNEKEDKLSDDNIHCKIKTKFKVFDLKLNYKYLRIILIAVSNNVELFEIPEIPNQDKITNPKFIFKENKSMVNCALFKKTLNSEHRLLRYSRKNEMGLKW